jgi:hypothetical protein
MKKTTKEGRQGQDKDKDKKDEKKETKKEPLELKEFPEAVNAVVFTPDSTRCSRSVMTTCCALQRRRRQGSQKVRPHEGLAQ